MGPRFCKRGNAAGAFVARVTGALQWGHAFVSVETRVEDQTYARYGASMGPRFCKRGNCSRLAGHLAPSTASMGPRFCKRGNARPLDDVLSRDVASMGPRFCKRGNKVLSADAFSQHGRFNGATLL